uniref:Evasin n=1 Tax=Rhipicephalus appendiculatus TaxID=34631 RepID=A0A131YSF7_RHIAP
MIFKACITVITMVYAVQIICGAGDSSADLVSGSSSSSEEDCEEDPNATVSYDYNACPYYSLAIGNNDSLALNCSTICDVPLNDTMPCVNATSPPLNFSIPQNYTCTVGSCDGGVCLSNKTQNVSCWVDDSESEGDQLSERADFIELY